MVRRIRAAGAARGRDKQDRLATGQELRDSERDFIGASGRQRLKAHLRAAGNRSSPFPPAPSLTMMLPSSAQLAPPKLATSPSGTTAPPSTETLLTLTPTAKPTHCPSGEKNGRAAFCVPGSSVALD